MAERKSALPQKADIPRRHLEVRQGPISDIPFIQSIISTAVPTGNSNRLTIARESVDTSF